MMSEKSNLRRFLKFKGKSRAIEPVSSSSGHAYVRNIHICWALFLVPVLFYSLKFYQNIKMSDLFCFRNATYLSVSGMEEYFSKAGPQEGTIT